MTNNWSKAPGVSLGDEQDALHSLTTMMTGTKLLQDEPGVVYSLAAQKAAPADAQAVDQFMQALDAEKAVNIARSAGSQIRLTDQQQTLLKANGVAFTDVMSTPQTVAQTTQQHILDQSQGNVQAKLNNDGSLQLDANGNVVTEKVHKSSDGGSFWGSVGGFFGGIGHDLNNWVLKPLNKAYNFVNSGVRGQFADQLPGHQLLDVQDNIAHADATRAQDMTAQGYDPNSIWSNFAFAASGRAHSDLSGLDDKYGASQVTDALKFLEDPSALRKGIDADPASYYKDASGQTHLTADAQARLVHYNSPEFTDLAKRVNAQQNTVGNGLANAIGLDPVKHSTTYAWTAGVSNVIASFAIDPTMIALNVAKAAKLAQVGISSLADGAGAAAVLTRDGHYAKNVQRGWQRAIDLGAAMRDAHSAGDTVELAKLTAQFTAELPGLSPMMPEFVGKYAFTGFRNPTEAERAAGQTAALPKFGETGGIQSLEQAADFVQSKWGLSLVQNGRAATQAGLMPGALSAMGYRKLKGFTAGWMTARSAKRAEGAYADVVSRADADPLLAGRLVDEGLLMRLGAKADDAVDFHSETVLADKADAAADTLPSQARAAYAVTSAGKGQIARNLRASGDELADSSKLGWASGTAVAARARLAAQRFTTLLPRNTLIDLHASDSGDKVYKLAMTFLNRGDSQTLRAAWNLGNAGERKAIISGLVDQLGHAAGMGSTPAGKMLLDRAKTVEERYSAAGSEIELDGQKVALLDGQTRQKWLLPSFRDMQQSGAKLGLWDATAGRALTSGSADLLMSQWKMGALFKPSTVTRNQLEGWLRTVLEGRAGDAVKAKAIATTRNKELWDRGYQLDTDARKAYEVAVAAGDTAKASEIANGSMLSGELLGRSSPMTRLANLAPLAWVGKSYRTLLGKHMDAETVDALMTLTPEELAEAMEGYGQQILEGDLGIKHAVNQSTEIARAGFGPSKIRWSIHRAMDRGKGAPTGTERHWVESPLDGTVGVGRYVNSLAQRVNASPETARAALQYIEDPKLGVDHVVQAMEKEQQHTAFGKVYFDDPLGAPNTARKAVNAAETTMGKRDWAQKVVDEYAYLLTGRNGEYQTELSDYIKTHGNAPNEDWITDHLTGDKIPHTALAPEVMAQPAGGIKSMPAALQDVEGGAYQWMVERVLQRTTSSPVFLANYAIARKGLNTQVDEMVAAGITPEAASGLAKDLAMRNAWVKTEQLIDDPGQKTQFDVIARNMIPFARATQAMVRRWGTGLWQNPVAARKMMLAYEGAEHTGLIYNNTYGEPTFTYPGSGVLNMALRGLAQVPGFENVAAFPVASDMTGGVLMSVPGADNPFRMSMGPMISIPFREVYKHLLPTSWQGDLTKLDSFVNGPVGAGETFQQLVPTALRHYFQNVSADDRNSALASAMNGAIANLAAAGLVPPPDASPSELQDFRGRLQTQVHNQLIVRFIFGLFAPAAPSIPTEGTSGSHADYAWSVDGVKQLNDEYKTILNEVGGDVARANAVFTAMHPDQLVYDSSGNVSLYKPTSSAYETGRSKMLASGSYVPATDKALSWMTQNQDFIHTYSSVAAYFVPNESTKDPFSDAAYQTQLELGLRQRKTPAEFMADIYVKHAESQFYPTVAEYDRRIAAAKASGDTATAASLTQSKSAWEAQFKALNPAMGHKLDDYGAARATASDQLADLRTMLSKGAVPDGQANKLQQLVSTWDNYESFIRTQPGSTDAARLARSNALNAFNEWAQHALASTGLADVYNGVFRVLNTNLTKLNGG